ncbi:hypothetical protein L6452_40064 [Arctium lappa]|uniref:Uncharacterized protein n=1 Tax=Arctium lappa TaxID=4217 RepID=A0ACB8XU50_ARCLA|nr:hypothetical protein L6452_40064 [Arctium lappa]
MRPAGEAPSPRAAHAAAAHLAGCEDVTQRLCTSTELKLYFEGFFLGNSYERPNGNCNLTTTVSGYGWYQLLAFYGVLKKYAGRVKGSDHNHWNNIDFDAKPISIMSTIGGAGVLGRQGHAANLDPNWSYKLLLSN